MAISIESITEYAAESVTWSVSDGYLSTDADDLRDVIGDAIHTAIDGTLVYTGDVVDAWRHYGMPEPEELGMADTLSTSVTHAVYEYLRENVTDDDVANAVLDQFETALSDADIDRDALDPLDALAALVEYVSTL